MSWRRSAQKQNWPTALLIAMDETDAWRAVRSSTGASDPVPYNVTTPDAPPMTAHSTSAVLAGGQDRAAAGDRGAGAGAAWTSPTTATWWSAPVVK
ncbi:hypothetical protein [Kutzneria sp. NPDC051319]|uniref:hypothetical protein n=1 Tax=Kutzneria sp. NPDC051319 TaxID=3155047 RepID=UPI0034223142